LLKKQITNLLVSTSILAIALVLSGSVIAQGVAPPLYEEEGGPLPSLELPAVKPETWDGLKPGHGREETYYSCAPCHTHTRIKDKSMTRRQWSETLDMLTRDHDVAPLEAQEREIILDYLAAQYGLRKPW
jgi:hypothetical protein